jgi:hypothetical protein
VDKTYGFDVYAYLARARCQLDVEDNAALFYAALELRCGIEARVQQYLDAREDIAKHKKKGWRLATSEKELNRVSKSIFGIAEVILSADDASGLARLFYTPVRQSLVRAGEQLGELLHRIRSNREHSDPWWGDVRNKLETTFTALEFASLGTLLAPPMQSPNKNQIHINAFYHKTNFVAVAVEALARLPKGTRTNVSVHYHLGLPAHASPYLNRWRVDL